jgi:hypothetical protein
MNKDDVKLIKVKPNTWTSTYERNKGFQRLAQVFIEYHELTVICDLMQGDTGKGGFFHFLSMPYNTFKMKDGTIHKFNLFNWNQKKHSDEFQVLGLSLVIEKYPGLFRKEIREDKCNQK